MNVIFRLASLFAVVVCASVALRGQTTVPTLTRSVPAQATAVGVSLSFDLRNVFAVPGVSGQIAQFDTVLGKFNVELLAGDAPLSVANFLSYVGAGSYSNTIFHRATPLDTINRANWIVQGGGYDPAGTAIAQQASIALEYKLSNVRGTLAMARTVAANSATSEWFFNVGDNSSVLGANNGGGYAVFGRVIGTGMSVVDAISALPIYNVGGAFSTIPLRNVQSGQATVQLANLIIVNSITPLPVFPTGGGAAVVSFVVSNSNSAAVSASLSGSTLLLTPVSGGNAAITVRATDTNGSFAETAFAVSVVPGPVFSTQPGSQTVNAGDSITLTAAAIGATSFQWQRNGVDLAGATGASLTLTNVQPANAGVYFVRASEGSATRRSEPAVVALASASKVIGAASEVGPNIVHQNGNVYDQVLLEGAAATITADPGQIVRMSYIDANDDIVQVEFSGAGALTVALDNPSGPATPVKYNQSVTYMKGQAAIVVGGVDATTNLSIFSVGRANAVNQALFRSEVAYDGMADISLVAIAPASGAIGGVRTANARYTGSSGLVGVYAPRVAISGPLFIGNVAASGAGVPVIVTGSAGDVRITGGSLQEPNGAAVQVDGMTRIQMAAGTDSHGNLQPAQALSGRLERSGVDVTSVMVPAGG